MGVTQTETILLRVEDAYKDRYLMDFTVEVDEDEGERLLCPLCGTILYSNSCASGHIAYTIIDNAKLEKIADVLTR